jgi:hypothetical protein
MAMMSLQPEMEEYFRVNFPVTAKLLKIVKENKGIAETVLIKAGKKHGVKIGDKFKVEALEMLDGELLTTEIAIITVQQLQSEAFSECKVDKKDGQTLFDRFNAGNKMRCSLIIK